MNKFVVSAALAGALITSPALGDDELHCPKPGTRISFNNYAPIEFVGQEGLVCLVKVADSKSPGGVRVARVLLGLNTSDSWAENHVERLWPFKIGNEVEFTSSGDSSHIVGGASTSSDRIYYRDTIKVLRQEKLVTKVGTFDTWVIEDRQISLSSRLNGTWLNTFWWAPDVGYFVKRTYEVRAGLGQDTTSEITSLTTPPLASPPATSSVTPPAPSTPAPVATPPATPAASTPPPAPATPTKSAKTTTTSTPSAPAPSPPPSGSAADRLQALKDLLDHKLITPSEYETKRKAIIDAM